MEEKYIHTKDIDELITTYLTDGLDVESQKQLQDWLASSPENKKYFLRMQEVWFASIHHDTMKRFNKDDAYQRFLIRTAREKARSSIPARKRKVSLIPYLYGAAAVILLFLVSLVSYWKGESQLKNQFADITIEAPFGSKIKMYLPDSSLVWLNAGSRIIYSQGFGVNERNIQLTGEGYFEVTRNEKLPFEVNTQELQVKVLGTKFNFKNYPDDEEASVCLLEGKVLVNNATRANNKVNLLPNQKIFLSKKTGSMRIAKTNARYSAEWTKGFLFFDEELLLDIIKKLERSYDVKITLKDKSLETFRFYGNIIRKENTIEDVLEMLASTDKLNYKMQGKEIELSLK